MEDKTKDAFLKINKKYFNLGLKSIDILILSQIEEFQRNEHECYITNKQFSEMFGESESTIKRSIDKLESLNIIQRNTQFIKGNGKGTKQRVLSINNYKDWKVHNEPTNTCKVQNLKMEGSNDEFGRFKNQECKVHNEPIKDNLKENKKKTLKDTESLQRKIEELEDWECEDICKRISKHESYVSITNLYNLKPGSITKDFPKWWKEKLKNRTYLLEQQLEAERRKNEPIIDYSQLYARVNNQEKEQEQQKHQQMIEEVMQELFI